MALRSVRLSAKGARILGMLAPFPWEPGGWASQHTSVQVSGTKVEWDAGYDSTILAQSSPSIGFPAGDAKRIRAAIPGYMTPQDRRDRDRRAQETSSRVFREQHGYRRTRRRSAPRTHAARLRRSRGVR